MKDKKIISNEILPAWQRLRDKVNQRGADGDALVEAMKDYYSIYTTDLLRWAGGLFDSDIGGFYFSNSARDNEFTEYRGNTCRLLPDVESTVQCLNFLSAVGVLDDCTELPLWMREKIKSFVCSLQDPDDGYIYHPQWTRESVTASRLARDMVWATHIAKKLGFSLPYPTAYDRIKEHLSSKEADTNENIIPEEFRSEEAFLKYISSLNWKGSGSYGAYGAGNRIAAQSRQIEAAGLTDVAVNYLNSIQNSDNGLWGDAVGYDGNNAFMKISAFYDTVGRPIPRASLAVKNALDCLVTDEFARTSCYNFNVWYSILNVLQNLRRFGGEDGVREAAEISDFLLSSAPKYILGTKKKILTFRKKDGSFSCLTNSTTPISQGMPVAVEGTDEGDFNALALNSSGTVIRIYACLGLSDYYVPLFEKHALDIFLSSIKKPSIGEDT